MSMSERRPDEASDTTDSYLKGTTYRVYRFMLKEGRPVGISEVQRALGLSSPSVSQYHIKKLLRLGIVKEEQAGYVVDRVIVENVIRIRRISIPVQTAYVAFFGTTLAVMLTFLRPVTIDSIYFFAIVINLSALFVSLYEMAKTWKRM